MISIGSTQRKSSIAGTANLSVTKVDSELQKPANPARQHAAISRILGRQKVEKRTSSTSGLTESASNRVRDIST
jgi:hypothetical protein